MHHHCLHSHHILCCAQHWLVSVRSDKVVGGCFGCRGCSFIFWGVNKSLLDCCNLICKERVGFLLGRNIRPATQRAARRCAGTHPGPLGCLSTSPRTVPARSSASATHVVPSCPIPMSCSLGGRKLRVDSAPMMAQQCVILTVRLSSSGGP